MGLAANCYYKGGGTLGFEQNDAASSGIEKWIPGKAGGKIVITGCQAYVGTAAGEDAVVFMKVLNTESLAVACTAGTTVVDVGTSLNLDFAAHDGDTATVLAADDLVAIELDDGTFHFDYVTGITATDGSFHTDTAVLSAAAVGNAVYMFGSTADAGHCEVLVGTDPNDNVYGDFIATAAAKGDPMVVYMTDGATSANTTDVGAARLNNSINLIEYVYANC